jgi:adenylylsulfate kinase-like enzyme
MASRELGGRLFWLTGLSGAGKTDIAERLRQRFQKHGRRVVLLDGDALRGIMGPRFGHAPADRRYLAGCYARLCKALTEQGLDVICATISMVEAVRAWCRAEIPGYCEIYLRVPPQERRRRDPKQLYRRDGARMVEFAGDFEEPRTPDLVIDNFGACTAEQAADAIWNRCVAGKEEHAGSLAAR